MIPAWRALRRICRTTRRITRHAPNVRSRGSRVIPNSRRPAVVRPVKRWTLAVAAAIVIGNVPPQAHHSISSVYDSSRQVTVEGIVSQFQLVNPHPFLFIDVKDDNGTAQLWRLEMDNRYELVNIGVAAGTFRPGERVVVTGSLARTQAQQLYLLRLDRPADGFWYEQVGLSPRVGTARPPG
jgi:hypothetical protein